MSIPERPARHPVTVHRRGLPGLSSRCSWRAHPCRSTPRIATRRAAFSILATRATRRNRCGSRRPAPAPSGLEAAEKSTTVDQWTKTRRGLNITGSPFISNGNGGTHKLYDTSDNKDCLLDTQNQKGGINLPQLNFPNLKPPNGVLPPTANCSRTFSGLAGCPPFRCVPPSGRCQPPSRPPGGMPNLPSWPPSGVMPTLPGALTPPVATRPPTGITPTFRPGHRLERCRPCLGPRRRRFGTLPPTRVDARPSDAPPTGAMPTLPVRRAAAGRHAAADDAAEGGVRPTVPGGPTPPIGTLPPTGATARCRPSRGGATPPIGTLPAPTGATPPRPLPT